jgi:hypothetical protein
MRLQRITAPPKSKHAAYWVYDENSVVETNPPDLRLEDHLRRVVAPDKQEAAVASYRKTIEKHTRSCYGRAYGHKLLASVEIFNGEIEIMFDNDLKYTPQMLKEMIRRVKRAIRGMQWPVQ